MNPRILFLAAALTLVALPVKVQAQTALQNKVAEAFEAEEEAWKELAWAAVASGRTSEVLALEFDAGAEIATAEAQAWEMQAQEWETLSEAEKAGRKQLAALDMQQGVERYSMFMRSWHEAIGSSAWGRRMSEQSIQTMTHLAQRYEVVSMFSDWGLRYRKNAWRAGAFALNARETALGARETASNARQYALEARENASYAREGASQAREYISYAHEYVSGVQEYISEAQEYISEAQKATSGWEEYALEIGGYKYDNDWETLKRVEQMQERVSHAAQAWKNASQAWEKALRAWEKAEKEQGKTKGKRETFSAEARLAAEARATKIRWIRERRVAEAEAEAERERRMTEAKLEWEAVVAAYETQAQAWDAEADYYFVAYDGQNSDEKAKAAGERVNASRAWEWASFAQETASEAHLHALRARTNASDMQRASGQNTGGLKDLANKAAEAWETAAQAWEAIAEY